MTPSTDSPKPPGALAQRWQAISPRERALVLLAALAVGLALLWWTAVAPALRVLRDAPVRLAKAQTDLQHMQALGAEAQRLRAQARPGPDEALRVLDQATRARLGPGTQLSVSGDRATVVLKAAPADGLAQWLAQVREGARALPVDVRLTRTPAGWDGTVVMQLAPR